MKSEHLPSVIVETRWVKWGVAALVSICFGLLNWLTNPIFDSLHISEHRLYDSITLAVFALIGMVLYNLLLKSVRSRMFYNQIEVEQCWVDQMMRQSDILNKLLKDFDAVPDFVKILHGHLDDANSNTEKGAIDIMTALGRVASKSRTLMENLEQQGCKAQHIDQSYSASLIEKTSILKQTIHDYEARITDNSKRIQAVLQGIEGLSGMTQVIRKIAAQTNLLALNAAIEAARAGEVGRGFAVVADEVRKLSQQTEEATSLIDMTIQQVENDVFKQLSAIATQIQTDDENQKVQDIGAALEAMNHAFVEVSGYLSSSTVITHQAMNQIHEDIVDALGCMQFQDISRQQIEHVNLSLNTLSEHFITLAEVARSNDSGISCSPLEARVEALRENYVMHSQHATHNAVKGQSAAVVELPSIQLF